MLRSIALCLAALVCLSSSVFAQLDNDVCGDAAAMIYGKVYAGTTVDSVDEGIFTAGCDAAYTKDVWYSYSTAVAGKYSVDVTGVQDVSLAIYDSCGNVNPIACDVSYYGVSTQARTLVDFAAGPTYYIRVASMVGQEDAFDISVSMAADIELDGVIDIADFEILADEWLAGTPAGDVPSRTDIEPVAANGDQIIDLFDFAGLAGAWGQTPGATNLITINVIGDGTVEPAAGSYTYWSGDVINLTATPGNDMGLKYWSGTDDDAHTGLTNIHTVAGNATITVVFGPMFMLTTKVHYTGHGTIDPIALPTTHEYVEGTVVTVSGFPNPGYQVATGGLGWFGTDDDSLSTPTNTVTMNANHYVEVRFEKK